MPSWLKFDDSTCTFTGIPMRVDYPTLNQVFPIKITIVLKVIDRLDLYTISNGYILSITNYPP